MTGIFDYEDDQVDLFCAEVDCLNVADANLVPAAGLGLVHPICYRCLAGFANLQTEVIAVLPIRRAAGDLGACGGEAPGQEVPLCSR